MGALDVPRGGLMTPRTALTKMLLKQQNSLKAEYQVETGDAPRKRHFKNNKALS